ncbi:MAG: MBL fold metallo-hydrolase [Candidatus Bathyarchaeia archaeon]
MEVDRMSGETSMRIIGMGLGFPSILESCRITIIIDDAPAIYGRLFHKHGLSILIEAISENLKAKILFDAGPSPGMLLHNVRALNLRLDDLDAVVLSHGHYDHTDGLPAVLKYPSRRIPVIVHPEALNPKFTYKPHLTYIGHGLDHPFIADNGGVLTPTRKPITITSGIRTSGEIPLNTSYEKPKGFWKMGGAGLVEDSMTDEQALIIGLKDKGLVVVAGCAHRGIINTVRHAQRIMECKKVHAIIGGFHLSDASDELVHMTIDALKEDVSPDRVYPCHCAGARAIEALREAFGDRCKQLSTGDLIVLT